MNIHVLVPLLVNRGMQDVALVRKGGIVPVGRDSSETLVLLPSASGHNLPLQSSSSLPFYGCALGLGLWAP